MIFHLCRESITHKTDGFPMAYYSVDEAHPRYFMLHHWHPEAEFVLVRRGTLTLTLEGRTVDLTAGEFALLPPGAVHNGIPSQAHYECIVFDGEELTRILQGFAKEKADKILSCGTMGHQPSPLPALAEILQKRETGYQPRAIAAFFSLLGQWICIPEEEFCPLLPPLRKSRLIPFEKAVLYIREHYKEPITLRSISEAAGLSEKYFGEYFRNITGKTPIHYLNEYRTERAAELLIRKEKTVTEVALECGFNDLSYFIKTFRCHYETSPGNYRKSKKAE